MTDASYEAIRDGHVARTVCIRTDLLVDLDAAGRVIGVERIGDEVRSRDLEHVIRELTYVDRPDDP